jgi:hypothetical protein
MKLSSKAKAVHKAAMANKAVSEEILASVSGPSTISAEFATSGLTSDAAFAATKVGDIVIVMGASPSQAVALADATGPSAPTAGDLVLVIRK